MHGLTERQKICLDFIVDRVKRDLNSPSFKDIGEHMGIGSTNAVKDHLVALQKKGYIRHEFYKKRRIYLTDITRRLYGLYFVGVDNIGTANG